MARNPVGVDSLDTISASLRRHIRECTGVRKETKELIQKTNDAVENLDESLRSIRNLHATVTSVGKWAWRVIGTILLAIIGSAAMVMFQSYQASQAAEHAAAAALLVAKTSETNGQTINRKLDTVVKQTQ